MFVADKKQQVNLPNLSVAWLLNILRNLPQTYNLLSSKSGILKLPASIKYPYDFYCSIQRRYSWRNPTFVSIFEIWSLSSSAWWQTSGQICGNKSGCANFMLFLVFPSVSKNLKRVMAYYKTISQISERKKQFL
jgi:hypothetical protein